MWKPQETLRTLRKIREVRRTKPPEQAKGFAFIPSTFRDRYPCWPLHPGVHPNTSAEEYLRMIALSRIMLPNVLIIQASWFTVGRQ